MSFLAPRAGMVIRYSYLWRSEQRRGLEEGLKDRPCAVLLAVTGGAGERRVVVLPITHAPPRDPAEAVELPHSTKRRLDLDDQRSWIVLTEANRFVWPGPDLRPARPGNSASIVYGELPGDLLRTLRERWLSLSETRRSVVTRTE